MDFALASVLYSAVCPNFVFIKVMHQVEHSKLYACPVVKDFFPKIATGSLMRLMHLYWVMAAWVRGGLNSRCLRVCSDH